MSDPKFSICGEVSLWPEKDQMAAILRNAGLRVNVGRYSIRIEDCAHFVFRQYGDDFGEPCIDAECGSLEFMLKDATLVSNALAKAGLRHRFELYDEDAEQVGYLHHEWPSSDVASDIT
ncbi:MAG: hypothetical protein QM811_05295 [Pirellulales bacterium]